MKLPGRLTSSMFRPISSLTRIPVAYRTSSMALSRQPFISETLGCCKRSSTSFPVRICGSFFSALSILMFCMGFSSISWIWIANMYRLLIEASAREIVAADLPPAFMLPM